MKKRNPPHRGKCRGCSVYVQVKKDGTMRPHKTWVDGLWVDCPGITQPPRAGTVIK